MSTLGHSFNDIASSSAKSDTDAPKYPPPFSIRFTFEERARLDAARGRKALAAHIREELFGDNVSPRRRPGNSSVKDAEALARVLGALGASWRHVHHLPKSVASGSFARRANFRYKPDIEADILKDIFLLT